MGRFLSVDPVEGGTDNSYVYVNDPVNETDLTGNVVDTVLDVAGIGYDSVELYKNPSWGNAGMLAWSVGAAFIPFVPGSYVGRAGAAASKAVTKAPPASSAPKQSAKPPAPAPRPPAKKPPTNKPSGSAPRTDSTSLKARAYNSSSLGRLSPLFGAKQLGAKQSGSWNNNDFVRLGWSTHGGKKTFRLAFGKNGAKLHFEVIFFKGYFK